jgi:hypothetical protein
MPSNNMKDTEYYQSGRMVELLKEAGMKAKVAVQLKKEKRMEEYANNPKRCLICNEPIPYKRKAVQTYCSVRCGQEGKVGRRHSDETKAKLSKINKGRPSPSLNETLDQKLQRIDKQIKTLELKRRNTPFVDLSYMRKRELILVEQENRCAKCGIGEWMGMTLTLEVDHKDGDNTNNNRGNLEALCPNCHSLTPTWRGRNRSGKNGVTNVTDGDLIIALCETDNIRQALLKVGLAAKGNNYDRVKTIINNIDTNVYEKVKVGNGVHTIRKK